MDTSHPIELSHALETTAGPVHAVAQGDRTLYVRAGEQSDRDMLDAAREPLRFKRGIELRVRAHFFLDESTGEWRSRQPFIYRVDDPGKEPTARQSRELLDVVGAALKTWAETATGRVTLAHARRVKAEADAASRVATALELRRCADALDREAAALRAGGRVSYRRSNMNGLDVRTAQIITVDGELMPALKNPPTVYGATDWPDSLKDNREEDRW